MKQHFINNISIPHFICVHDSTLRMIAALMQCYERYIGWRISQVLACCFEALSPTTETSIFHMYLCIYYIKTPILRPPLGLKTIYILKWFHYRILKLRSTTNTRWLEPSEFERPGNWSCSNVLKSRYESNLVVINKWF